MATLPDAKYGEATDFAQIQQGSPLSPSAGAPMPSAGGTSPPGIMDDTAHPNMPVTSGADAGPGPGSDSLGLPNTTDEAADLARRYGGILPLLIRKADDPRSSQQFKDQVRYLISKIG